MRISALFAVALLAFATCTCATSPVHSNDSLGSSGNAGSVREGEPAQRLTIGVLSRLVMVVDLHVRTRGKAPLSLEALLSDEEFFVAPEKRADWIVDGWGRKVHYYSNGSDYCLMSFGQDGMPDSDGIEPGGFSPSGEFEADIVVVNGRWAVSPQGLGR